MNKYLLIGVVAVLIIAGGWSYFNQSNAPIGMGMEKLSTTEQQGVQQQPTNPTPTAPTKTYSYENSGNLKSFTSPAGTYSVMYEAQSPGSFRIVETASKKVLSDYKPKTGRAVICEMMCYPFAEWLNNTTLIIGSYSLVNNEWSAGNPARRHDVVVFDVSLETYRPATQSEIAQFDLYNDTNLSWQ